ncbi:hypothetical protein Cadr_000000918 [Camelus dromedarius]|uniref:Uncharacterized protein n=1 Tax=Camelus dromedarius TaxID=9838 RepID=A0A5N4EIP1_CAMDR|nr:hypothetical protein Cadr_000000918 [Camelus dromedarius]
MCPIPTTALPQSHVGPVEGPGVTCHNLPPTTLRRNSEDDSSSQHCGKRPQRSDIVCHQDRNPLLLKVSTHSPHSLLPPGGQGRPLVEKRCKAVNYLPVEAITNSENRILQAWEARPCVQ